MMKQTFKLVDNLEQEFWLEKCQMQFIASSLNLKNG
jgi:hypothetical protein